MVRFVKIFVVLFLYPELYAVVGSQVPDYQGMFLRGVGGNAAGLGYIQEDAGRLVSGVLAAETQGGSGGNGVFYATDYWNKNSVMARRSCNPSAGGHLNYGDANWITYLNSANEWGNNHTANEFRPVNRTVRYLIRAKS